MTFADVRGIALSLPAVTESTSYGTAAFKCGGKLVARLKEDGETLVIATTFEEREAMLADDPGRYFITDHYRNYPTVLVRLALVDADIMRDLLTRALRLGVPKKKR